MLSSAKALILNDGAHFYPWQRKSGCIDTVACPIPSVLSFLFMNIFLLLNVVFHFMAHILIVRKVRVLVCASGWWNYSTQHVSWAFCAEFLTHVSAESKKQLQAWTSSHSPKHQLWRLFHCREAHYLESEGSTNVPREGFGLFPCLSLQISRQSVGADGVHAGTCVVDCCLSFCLSVCLSVCLSLNKRSVFE